MRISDWSSDVCSSDLLQRTLVGAGDDAAAAAVVEQCVDGYLQHALFVAHDDVRRAQLDQPLETIVAVDDAAQEVVEVRGREEIGRASCRERVCQYVSISVVDVSLKKKEEKTYK